MNTNPTTQDLQDALQGYVAQNFLNSMGINPSIAPYTPSIQDNNPIPTPTVISPAMDNSTPTDSTPLPGQQAWVAMILQQDPTANIDDLNSLYQRAVKVVNPTASATLSTAPAATSSAMPRINFLQRQATPSGSMPVTTTLSPNDYVGNSTGPTPQSPQWNDLVSAATEASKSSGIPLSVILGQAYVETAGNPDNAPGNNWFGIKGSGNAGTQAQNTWENYGNGRVDITDNFGAYNNAKDSVNAYVDWVKSRPDVYALRNNPVALIQAVKNAGYATDPDYVSKVINNPVWSQYSVPQTPSVQVKQPQPSFQVPTVKAPTPQVSPVVKPVANVTPVPQNFSAVKKVATPVVKAPTKSIPTPQASWMSNALKMFGIK